MAIDQQRLSSAERSNLVAFLDEELTEVETSVIRKKLEQSVTGRHELDSLKRVWEVLDFLERPRVTDEFSTRTLTLATGQVLPDERLASAASLAARRVLSALAVAGLGLAVFAATYCLVRWAWPDPSSRLARDLSIAEHLGEYQAVESMEFLRQLDALPQFHRSESELGGLR
jgi:hypothetical protein